MLGQEEGRAGALLTRLVTWSPCVGLNPRARERRVGLNPRAREMGVGLNPRVRERIVGLNPRARGD